MSLNTLCQNTINLSHEVIPLRLDELVNAMCLQMKNEFLPWEWWQGPATAEVAVYQRRIASDLKPPKKLAQSLHRVYSIWLPRVRNCWEMALRCMQNLAFSSRLKVAKVLTV
jgi:hypothetical protein